MKKIIRLTESDLIRIVKRVLNEDLSVSDTGELIGNIQPNEELIRFFDGSITDNVSDILDALEEHGSVEKIEDSYEFGYIKVNGEYGFIKLDKNNGDEVYREDEQEIMVVIKDGYAYYSVLKAIYGPFSLYDKDPTVPDGEEELHITEMDVFPDFAMDMTRKGFKKYYFVYW